MLHACPFVLLKKSFLCVWTLCLSFMLLCIFYNDGLSIIIREFCEIKEREKQGKGKMLDFVELSVIKSICIVMWNNVKSNRNIASNAKHKNKGCSAKHKNNKCNIECDTKHRNMVMNATLNIGITNASLRKTTMPQATLNIDLRLFQ